MPNAGPEPHSAERGVLAVVIDEHAVAAVERALGDRVEQAERRHDRAGGQHLDLEVAAGHVVDLLRVVERVLVEDVLRRPRRLPAHARSGRSGPWRSSGSRASRHRRRRRWRRSGTCGAMAVRRAWPRRAIRFAGHDSSRNGSRPRSRRDAGSRCARAAVSPAVGVVFCRSATDCTARAGIIAQLRAGRDRAPADRREQSRRRAANGARAS